MTLIPSPKARCRGRFVLHRRHCAGKIMMMRLMMITSIGFLHQTAHRLGSFFIVNTLITQLYQSSKKTFLPTVLCKNPPSFQKQRSKRPILAALRGTILPPSAILRAKRGRCLSRLATSRTIALPNKRRRHQMDLTPCDPHTIPRVD